jgi:uncharacterized membrane protein YvlD (DUF360 family)
VRALVRIVVTVAVAAGVLLLLSPILPGFEVDGFWAAFAMALVAGVLNALVWPVVVRFALPLTVLTLGGIVLILNGLVALFAAWVVPGVTLNSLGDAILVVLALTLVVTILSAALSIDDEERFAAHTRHLLGRRGPPRDPDAVPGILFLEIDGLAHGVLQRALRDGDAPALARWVYEGTHHLHRWETDLSSQTGACQAGILHGNNHDIPAFRWWEKDRGAALVTNHPRDAAELERRVSDGRGLLFADGASRANILSGDAPHSLLTMSTVLDVRRGRLGSDYFAYFADPYNLSRTILLAIGDVVVELAAAYRQRRRDVRPRVHRGFKYALVRAWATAVQLDLQVESVIGDVRAGRPVVYTTFLAYDEVAHHSGIERVDTLAVLRRLDRRIARVATVAQRGPRPYELVVLSDHGQTQGTTFLQRYGVTLEALVSDATATAAISAEGSGEDEATGRLQAALAEAASGDGMGARALRASGQKPPPELPPPDGAAAPAELPEVVVMASGCLGLISFPRRPGRVTRQELDAAYPRLLTELRAHPGIGFLVVRDADGHDVVLGPRGEHRLDDGAVEGEDPLAPFGPRAARHVRRAAAFTHCPDVLLNSAYWEETDEVAAFEELVGSHGGLGGPQSHPFLLVPATWEAPTSEIVGAEGVHHFLRARLVALGHAAYAERAPAELAP